MNGKIFAWSFMAAFAGFLFGLDTAVISGAEKAIQQLWGLTDIQIGLAVAMALYGTVFGAMFGGIPADRMGRKRSLFWIGLIYFISSVGAALASDVNLFMLFRFLGGLAIGASSVVAPMYISEIAPAESRGRMVVLFQLNIVAGILIAYVSNYLLQGTGNEDWRWMLGVVAVPSFIFTILTFLIPESPRWLILKKNDVEGARKVLNVSQPDGVEGLIAEIQSSTDTSGAPKEPFFSKKYRFPIMLAFLFAFFNQWSGINAIIYYAPRIFEMAGFGKSASLFSTAGIGLVNLIFTMCGGLIIDRFGRRSLMLVGSVGLIGALGLVSWAFFKEQYSGVPYFLFTYIAFFAFSQGAVIWVFISEIFPNAVRAYGQSFGSFTHWIFAAIIANAFPYFAGRFGGGPIFLFFCSMMVLQLVYVWKLMPETKGVSLETLQERMTGRPYDS